MQAAVFCRTSLPAGGNPFIAGVSAGGVAGALSLLQNGGLGGGASPASHHLHGHNLVVFVSNNNVSQLAVEAALAVARYVVLNDHGGDLFIQR
jgi:hypothetical protein